jgi:hypothetical protein
MDPITPRFFVEVIYTVRMTSKGFPKIRAFIPANVPQNTYNLKPVLMYFFLVKYSEDAK